MKTKILVLASNPRDTDQLRLNQEIREIEDALVRTGKKEQFSFKSKVAVRIQDLQRTIRQEQPRIVHFCGHGTGSQGLVLETDSGQQQLVNTQGIADLLRLFATQVECVVLNACYSEVQAEAIKQHINYVVGTKKAIRDDAAVAFSKGFYEALGDGESIERAYKFGCNRIQLEIYGSNSQGRKLVPVFLATEGKYIELPQHEILELLIRKPLRKIKRPFVAPLPLRPTDSKERQFRQILLNKVNEYWLYILKEKLSSKVKIELALETRSDLAENPFGDQQVRIDIPSVDTDIENIFAQWEDGQRLLILGDPGAGKTIALLQLAKKFYDRAQENILDEPIPAVFHLSSWQFGQSIDEWLIQELCSKYGFPRKEAENWVKDRNLFLFLDGFDHVSTEYQQECVREINKFGASNIVICSRIQQYETLPENVRLTGRAVYIKPLIPIQINEYLETLNKPGLKKVLYQEKKLLDLAKIPFWLDLMTEIQENLPREGSSEQRKQELFDEYIKKTFYDFSHKFGKYKYDQSKVIKWLTWLASKSRSKSKSVFLIEEMQPSWLNKEQKKRYLIATLLNGLLLGLFFGIPYGLIVTFYFSFINKGSPDFLKEGIILGIAAGSILGMSAQYLLKVHKLRIKTHKEVHLSWEKARIFLKKSLKRSIYEAIVIGVIVFLFCYLFYSFTSSGQISIKLDKNSMGLSMGLIIGTFFGIVTLITRLLSNSLVDKKEVITIKPNQGILDSGKKAYLMAKVTTAVLAVAISTIILVLPKENIANLLVSLFLGGCVALVTGGVAAFIHHSGRSCQQHLALRIVLYTTDCIPWNYGNFLDYASQLSFLNKIGGGYQFFNEMFKEYLASPKPNQMDV